MDAPPPHSAGTPGDQVAVNRARQREIYGEPLGERVRRLTTGLGITQARLAETLGLSPAMLSQLSGARRVKIGDPAVLGRMAALDRRVSDGPVPPADVPALLAAVRSGTTPWGPEKPCRCAAGEPNPLVPRPRSPRGRAPGQGAAPEDALRGATSPARLIAAAAAIAPSFPEIAEVLRRAAARR